MSADPLRFARAWILSEEIYPNRLSPEMLPALLRHLDLERTLVYAGKLAWILADQGLLDRNTQYVLLERLMPDVRKPLARWQLDTFPHKVLFFPNQILTLIKLVCLHSKPQGHESSLSTGDLYKLGTALLSITDLISRESERIHSSISELDRSERLAIELFTSAQLVRGRRLLFDVVRSKYLYVHKHQEANSDPPFDYLEIGKVFKEQIGISIQQFFEIGLATIFYYLRFRDLELSEYPPEDFIVLDMGTWFEPTNIPSDEIEHFIDFLSIGLDEMKLEVSREDRRSRGYDFLAMKKTPLLRIREDAVMPFWFDYLCERLTTGVYWAIFDSYKESSNEEKFARYNGYLFEKYASELLREIHERHSNTYKGAFLADIPFKIGKQEYKTPDSVLIEDDCIILVEATASRFRAYETIARGNPDAFAEDCEKIVFKKVDELDRFIRLIRSDKVIIDGKALDSSKEIYPVVVTIEETPPIRPINDYLRNEISDRGMLSFPNLAPLSIVSIEDIEDIDTRSQLSLRRELDEWHASRDFPYVSLAGFLHERYGEPSLSDDSFVSKVFHKVMDEATLSLFGLDFDEILARGEHNP